MFRALFMTALSMAVVALAASTASASVTLTSGGSFTANTTSRQELRTTVSGLIPVSITCSQSAAFDLTAGTYSGSNQVVGRLTSVTFTCDPTLLGTPTISALSLPWNIIADETAFNSSTGLIRLRGVQIEVTLGSVRCLFGNASSEIGIGVNNGSSTGTLLGGVLPSNSPACSNGSVSGSGYSFSRAVSWTIP
jgi:hypothetical protein